MPVSRGFDIVPAVVAAAAGTFDAEAAALTTAAVSLDQHLAAIGACWGDDSVGERFGAQYRPAADVVRDNVEALAVGLFRIAAALRAVANAHAQGETDLLVSVKLEDAELSATSALVATVSA
jgi:hypothetical protein